MACWLFIALIDGRFFKKAPPEQRYGLNLTAFEAKILKIGSQDLSALIPLRNDVKILSDLTIIVLICFNFSLSFLASPTKESEFDCLSKPVVSFSLEGFFLVSLLLFHDSFHIFVSYCSFMYFNVFVDTFCPHFEVKLPIFVFIWSDFKPINRVIVIIFFSFLSIYIQDILYLFRNSRHFLISFFISFFNNVVLRVLAFVFLADSLLLWYFFKHSRFVVGNQRLSLFKVLAERSLRVYFIVL